MGWLPLISHMCRVLQNGIFCQSLSRHQSNPREWGKKRGLLQNWQGEGRPRCWCLKCQMLWLRKVWIFSSSTLITTHERAENKNWLFRGQEGDWVAYGSPRQRCANAFFFPSLPSVFWMNKGICEEGLEESCLELNRTSDLKYSICIYQTGNRGLKKLGEPFTSSKWWLAPLHAPHPFLSCCLLPSCFESLVDGNCGLKGLLFKGSTGSCLRPWTSSNTTVADGAVWFAPTDTRDFLRSSYERSHWHGQY